MPGILHRPPQACPILLVQATPLWSCLLPPAPLILLSFTPLDSFLSTTLLSTLPLSLHIATCFFLQGVFSTSRPSTGLLPGQHLLFIHSLVARLAPSVQGGPFVKHNIPQLSSSTILDDNGFVSVALHRNHLQTESPASGQCRRCSIAAIFREANATLALYSSLRPIYHTLTRTSINPGPCAPFANTIPTDPYPSESHPKIARTTHPIHHD